LERVDAIVVGGGPAGSTCAWQLRRAGLDVAVVDKHNFPRDKVCAGWVTPAVVETLRLDVDEYRAGRVFQPIRSFMTGSMAGRMVETRYDEVASYGIRRFEFDHYLLDRSGAKQLTGHPVKRLERLGGIWRIDDLAEAPVVVGAGGHFCPIARHLGAKVGSTETIVAAHEAEFEMTEAQRADCAVAEETPEIFFCEDLQGYGWVFRKENVLNVGLGREDNRNIADQVRSFCDWLAARGRIPRDIPSKFKGHAYIVHGHSRRIASGDGIVLAGDAIGLAYDRSGEGIRPAVESAVITAEIIASAGGSFDETIFAGYERRLRERFGERGTETDPPAWLPAGLRQAVAAKLLGTSWFSRRVVLDDWFLHRRQPPLPAS
jgi:flavin-dependent dehydrogenase